MFLKSPLWFTLALLVFVPTAAAEYGVSGDWHANRDWLADHGINFDMSATQFYQGVAAGGREQTWDYGGKLDYYSAIEGGKLGLHENFFVDLHAETRFGDSVNNDDGLLAPSNIVMSFPEGDNHVTSITGLKFTQVFGESFALFMGKINTLDEYALQYAGGPGLGGFMNTSLVFNPIAARTVPYSAAGVGAAYLQDGLPRLTFTVFDPEERAVEGLDDLYARGVVLVPELILRPVICGQPGIYRIGATYSNAEYSSIEPSAWLDTVINMGTFPVETGSWSVDCDLYQTTWSDPRRGRSWGVFGQFGISDGNPNPIKYVINWGVAGHGVFAGRPLDRFGVGYFYLGLSDEFKTLAAAVLPQRDEYGVEMFYNAALTPNCWLTGDLQVVRPSTIGFETAIIPGMRLQVLF